nr:MAG TPA: hypothetical protein [Caudoviricetes sp.]
MTSSAISRLVIGRSYSFKMISIASCSFNSIIVKFKDWQI